MVFLGVDMAHDALNVNGLPRRIVRDAAQIADVGKAVRFHVRFRHHEQAVDVAQLVEARIVRVVGGAYRVDVVLLHQDQVALDAIYPYGAALLVIVIVAVHAVQLQVAVVHVEHAVAHLDVAESDALRDHFQHLSVRVF